MKRKKNAHPRRDQQFVEARNVILREFPQVPPNKVIIAAEELIRRATLESTKEQKSNV